MRQSSFFRIVVLVLALVGLVALIVSCEPQPEEPTPTPTPEEPTPTPTLEEPTPTPTLEEPTPEEPTPTSTPEEPTPTPTPETAAVRCTSPSRDDGAFRTGAYFVGRQVILSGPAGEVAEVRATFEDRLEPLRECTVVAQVEERQPADDVRSLLREPEPGEPGSERVYQRSPLADGEPYAMHLYQIPEGSEVGALIEEIEGRVAEMGFDVFADPNYVTGHLAKSACGAEGSPFSVEGSPFSVEGSPFSVEGSDIDHGGMAVDAEPDDFRNQQAFAMIAATPFPEEANTGEGVRVGVFDTSPFANSAEAQAFGNSLAPPLQLQQRELASSRRLTQHVPVSDTVAQHGLFVTGLIHALAPESDYTLYRVLDDRGCGDLYGLVEALHRFMAEASGLGGSLENVVINMSMGVLQPRNAGEEGLPEPVALLEAAVREAFERGAVLVAAAGNDSVSSELRLAAELPAAYWEVIGAAAVNYQAAPTCYSNEGDVAAPAGEAALDSDNDPPRCEPMAYTCTAAADGPDCRWGVISLANIAGTRTNYAYWVGTSFATPLVSGLAAAANEDMMQGAVYSAIVTNVTGISDTDFAEGVINVSGTLP